MSSRFKRIAHGHVMLSSGPDSRKWSWTAVVGSKEIIWIKPQQALSEPHPSAGEWEKGGRSVSSPCSQRSHRPPLLAGQGWLAGPWAFKVLSSLLSQPSSCWKGLSPRTPPTGSRDFGSGDGVKG